MSASRGATSVTMSRAAALAVQVPQTRLAGATCFAALLLPAALGCPADRAESSETPGADDDTRGRAGAADAKSARSADAQVAQADDPGFDPAIFPASGNSQRMIVGVGSRFPPMYDFTGPSPVGFDPDLIQGVATCLGKRGPVDFRGGGRVLDRAASGEVDVSIGALSIRPERERTVRFSAPYLFASLIVVGRTERAEELSGDLSGRTCVAGPSPVYTEVLASVACVRKSSSTTDDALAQVARGDADFAVVDSALGAMLPAGVQRTGRRLGEDRYGIAMARSNAGLKAAVDACLKQLDGDGFIEELRQRYDL